MSSTSRKRNALVWTVQGLLAALFLFAGAMKFVMPVQMLTEQSHLPAAFMLFIGIAEVAGGLGLILPGLTHVWEKLTPLAAAGLVIIMTGATIITAANVSATQATVPLVVGLLATFVARSRWQSLRTA